MTDRTDPSSVDWHAAEADACLSRLGVEPQGLAWAVMVGLLVFLAVESEKAWRRRGVRQQRTLPAGSASYPK